MQYLPRYTNHTALGIVWSRKNNFAVFESYILLFYQIFSSQIISKTRTTCRRTKGNLLPLLQESPQVFGIARLSEVRTIQISHKKNPILWVEKAEKQQIRDSCALYLYIYIYIYIYIYLVWLNFYKYPRETIKTIRTGKEP